MKRKMQCCSHPSLQTLLNSIHRPICGSKDAFLDYEDLSSSGLSGESTALGDKRVCSPSLALPLIAGRLAPLVVKAKHRLA